MPCTASTRWPAWSVIAVLALALGVVLAYLTDELSVAPATMVTLIVLAAFLYAGRELGAWPIAKWAIGRTMRSLRLLFPMVTRALPLLLLFMTFLFINAEVWQVSATLDGGVLWVTVLLFSFIALAFLLTRLPEELDHVDDEAEASSVVEVCRGTPLADVRPVGAGRGRLGGAARRADEGARPGEGQPAPGADRHPGTPGAVALGVGVRVLRRLRRRDHEARRAGGVDRLTIHALPYATNLSVELLQVSVFLAAFSGLYFTVYAVTDETYRDQFFTEIKAELEKAVGVRAVYLAARGDADTSATEPQA